MIQWGDVPTWVAAVGTVGTLASALWQIQTERERRIASDELSDIRDELETNLFGIIRVARAFAPVLAEQPRSSMVNVLSASVVGLVRPRL